MKILTLNAGSSSLKACVYETGRTRSSAEAGLPLWKAHVDWAHDNNGARVQMEKSGCAPTQQEMSGATTAAILDRVLESLFTGPDPLLSERDELDVAGHRVVHGGAKFRESVRVTPEVRAGIEKMAEFAPAHNHLELEGMKAVDRILGNRILQVAVFDTAFHATLPEIAYVYPGPYEWLAGGIRRYGFHGISHQYTSKRAAEVMAHPLESLRIVTCHLGNGCSLAAIRNGVSIDTTMGFTPLDGLMMGSRSGAVDPGILIHLLRHKQHDAGQLDRTLNQESGLKGISGVSADMREILSAIDAGNKRAQLAFDIYAQRVAAGIAAMAISLQGLDAIVFTAGVGENCARLRERVCSLLGLLGVDLDAGRNTQCQPDQDIAASNSKVRVLVVRTEEDWQIALECVRVVETQ